MDDYKSLPHTKDSDIYELFVAIWHEKRLIITAVLFTLAVGLIITFTSPTKYQAFIKIGDLSPSATTSLNNISFKQMLKTPPLTDLIRTLNSTSFQKHVINTIEKETGFYLFGSGQDYEKIYRFGQLFKYKEVKPYNKEQSPQESPFSYKLTFVAESPELAAKVLNIIINSAKLYQLNQYKSEFSAYKKGTLDRLKSDLAEQEEVALNDRMNRILVLSEQRALKTKQLNKELSLAKDVAKNELHAKIRNLLEAFNTAEALQITTPVSLNKLGNSKEPNIAVEINKNNEPLYLLGTKILTAELDLAKSQESQPQNSRIIELESKIRHLKQNPEAQLLKERVSDIPFTPILQELSNSIKSIQAEQFPEISLRYSRSEAIANPKPLTASLMLIIALSLILGTITGLLLCLIKIWYKKAILVPPEYSTQRVND